MKLLQFALVGCLVVGLAGCGSPTTKKTAATTTSGPAPVAATNKDKILGTWELVKAEGEAKIPPGTTVDYTKDGKMTLTLKDAMGKGKDFKMEGAYAVEGETLTTTVKGPDKKEKTEKNTITKLTDTEMEVKNKEGKKAEFKKK